MRFSIAAACFALAACASAPPPAEEAPAAPTATSAYIVAAVADARRPDADRERDAARHPAEMLAFAQVAPGQRVADLIPGGGYFTRLFAGALGAEGHVYAVPPPPRSGAPAQPALADVVEAYGAVTVTPQDFQQMTFPEPLDVVWTSQNYHDLRRARFNLDIAAINGAVLNALKPGGVYIVLDHSAVAGADMEVTETLHRIDQAVVRREVEAAGFVYEGETDVLRNPDDPRTASVFDASIRGRTDQFVMRFRKPG